MERPSDSTNDQYIDVLRSDSECDCSPYIKIKVQELIALLEGENKGYVEILKEYYRLATITYLSPEIDDEDAARLDGILAESESDQVLTFLIGEIDYLLGTQMGLLSPERMNDYKLQQARLSEHLAVGSPDPDFHRMLQLRLRKVGFYDGPIDGVLGRRSRDAVCRFQRSHAVRADGILGPKTVSILLQETGIKAHE